MENTKIHHNIGFDVTEDYEEVQHVEERSDGKWRFILKRSFWDGSDGTVYGKWQDTDPEFFFTIGV